ncbi:MAG: nucleotidyltransferase domain-containing protein [Spirochaetota bacterium]
MNKKAVLEIIARFRKSVESRGIRVAKLILFGSYAAGAFHEGSDIDIVVISEDFKGKNYWERIELLSDAIYEVFEPIEAIAMTPAEFESGVSFISDFARKGEVLYVA